MKIFIKGEIVLKQKIEEEEWVFIVSDVFHLSEEEYKENEKYNDTLGNYEPEKELPTDSEVTILASNKKGDVVYLKWSYPARGVYPHIRKKGWSKGLFVKLNQTLRNWEYPNA